jgi:AraC family transcriptional regulator, regulatory protein of adaptative response / methylated-DNA-[protein]-cysteine methyltransferase
MNLMIPETRLQHTPAAMHTDFAIDILSYATGECALGRVLVARSVNGVCAILIGADQDELEGDFAARFPRATLVHPRWEERFQPAFQELPMSLVGSLR